MERLRESRGYTREKAGKLSWTARRQRQGSGISDAVIDNNGSVEDTRKQIEGSWRTKLECNK